MFGGHVEPPESVEQALQRELGEELGIVPTRWEYLITLNEPQPELNGPGHYHFYRVTDWDGLPTNRQPHEHAQIRWFALDQTLGLELAHPAYVRLFKQFAAGTRHDTPEHDDEVNWPDQ